MNSFMLETPTTAEVAALELDNPTLLEMIEAIFCQISNNQIFQPQDVDSPASLITNTNQMFGFEKGPGLENLIFFQKNPRKTIPKGKTSERQRKKRNKKATAAQRLGAKKN
jgi:hypothetical protein